MCRLLGYVSAAPTSAAALVGEAQLTLFTELARVHGDGWGTAWLSPDDSMQSSRSTLSAVDDPTFAQMTHDDAAARIVHLRWATKAYHVRPTNTHPFLADGIAFAHNGVITPTDALDAMLDPLTKASLIGDTDSERYFALIRQELRDDPGDPAGAVSRAVAALRGCYPVASLNALLLTGAELIVVHANSVEAAPIGAITALADAAPLDHLEAYFAMRWIRTEDGSVVVASSGMDAHGWTPLAQESVTVIDLATQRMRTLLAPEHRTVG